MREGAYQLVNELENLCLKIEHPDRYLEINRLYTEMLRCNAFTTRKVLHLFKELFSRNSSLIPNTLLPYLSYIVDFTCSPRSPISIFRQLNREANNINHDLHKLLCKKNVAMYDLTLIVADDSTAADKLTPLDIFYTFYAEALMEKGICILDYKETTHQDARYLVLCDSMDNLYRLFIKTEKEYLHYKLGHIVESDDVISFKDIDTLDPRNTYNKKIKVFKRDGSALYIDAGATMLDFAFAVHSEIGLHFDYALVDGSKTRRPPYERLNEGDKITVVPSEEVKARIQWFKYVRTSKAVEHLVRYLG